MFGTVLILLSLLLGAVAHPSPALRDTTLLLSRQDNGETGIGPIAPGCESACNPLVPVYEHASVNDASVTCVGNTLNQVVACSTCEFKVLGFSQSEIDDKIKGLKDVCAAATSNNNGCGRLAAGGGMLGSVLVGLALVVL
ncbi:hypothetical protein B0H14DRAFT_791365 [Mycena olivaceomarginata]|nr:hypothetical protein B0H14DRAFT_791365 [Mycena olivaceomarginata]